MPWIRAIVYTLLVNGLLVSSVCGQQSSDLVPNNGGSSTLAPMPQTAGHSKSCGTGKQQKDAMQGEADKLEPGADPQNDRPAEFIRHLADDQKSFWMTPTRFQTKDVRWALPFAGVTAAFMASDQWLSKQAPAGDVRRSKAFSDYGTYSLVAAGAGSFLVGRLTGNDQMSEAGLLSGEAALNSTLVAYALKGITQRPRPFKGTGSGFFQGGDSFPSEHAAVAWSVASVLAHEYPGTLTKVLAYGLATGISATRVSGQQHFASDVVVGGALGWYFGHQVYRAHHDTNLGGSAWGDVVAQDFGQENTRNSANMGSPYVPLDSWTYPAIERLVALGYISSAHLNIRPWTRLECARLLEEVKSKIGDEDGPDNEGSRIYDELSKEFSDETARLDGSANLGASIDSLYAGFTQISGKPLRDGFHFGQTIINNYGRPYGEGTNSYDGFTAHAEAGPLSVFVQAEYQHSPAVGSDPIPVLQATADIDDTRPLQNGVARIDRLRLLTGAVAFTVDNAQISFGQQSLWLGPSEGGPFLFSGNAEPMTMLRIDSVSPYEIPLISRLLGDVKSEFFIGQLSGQRWEFSPTLFGPNLSSQPFVHGTKVSFHPTTNLEVGMGFTAQFGGPGNPFTWHNFLRTFYSHRVGVGNNPGKRLSEFDFSYRVPGLRNWLEIYSDSMVIDEYSPLGSNRPAINPGLYFSHLPKIEKVDLRMEGMTTDMNVPDHFGPGAFYWDDRYHSGYTNNGNLLGSWVGRRGRGEQGWATYWLTSRDKLQLEYRHNNVDKAFLGGGNYQDIGLHADLLLCKTFGVSGGLQFERWHFPVLQPNRQLNLSGSLQLTYWPKWKLRSSTPN